MHQIETTVPTKPLRAHVEQAVERLLVILDRLDGDADCEDGGDDEPSLGAPEGHASQVGWMRGADDDREIEARVPVSVSVAARRGVLEGALALLSRPETWCQRAMARDAAGNRVSPLDPQAVAWDIGGAVERAAGLDTAAGEAVDEVLHELAGCSLSALNDYGETTHADIVGLLRQARRDGVNPPVGATRALPPRGAKRPGRPWLPRVGR